MNAKFAVDIRHLQVLITLKRYDQVQTALARYASPLLKTQAKGTVEELEFIRLLNDYCRETGNYLLMDHYHYHDLLKKIVDAATGDKDLAVMALRYNALRILADFEARQSKLMKSYSTGKPDAQLQRESDAHKKQAAQLADELRHRYREFKSGRAPVDSSLLYLLSLSEVVDSGALTLEEQEELLAMLKRDLVGLYGVRDTPQSAEWRPSLICRYVDACINVRYARLMKESKDKNAARVYQQTVKELEREIRATINPLLRVAAENGAIPETMPWTKGKNYSEPVAIVELYRILDILVKPSVPSSDFEGMAESILEGLDSRFIARIKSAA